MSKSKFSRVSCALPVMVWVYYAAIAPIAFGQAGDWGRVQMSTATADSHNEITIAPIGTDPRRIAAEFEANPSSGPRGGGLLFVECSGLLDYPTIQSAIDAAVDGDVVVVFPNDCAPDDRWHENIDFLGKAIIVQSVNPTTEGTVQGTIIDGSGVGPVVRFQSGEGTDSILDGLTITNGSGANDQEGGGINCLDSSPTIKRCIIRNNASMSGGGLRIDSTNSVTVQTCRFIENSTSVSGAEGSAIASVNSALPFLFDCMFSGHNDDVVYLPDSLPATCDEPPCEVMLRCQFFNNPAATVVTGDGFIMSDCEFTNNQGTCVKGNELFVIDSLFEDNNAGGNVLFSGTGATRLERTDFVNNETTSSGNLISLPVATHIKQCTFDDNRAPNGIMLLFTGGMLIEDCTFTNNESRLGAFCTVSFNTSKMDRCLFSGNSATDGGGALWVPSGAPNPTGFVRDTMFLNNSSESEGGAVYGNGTFKNCLFAGNSANNNGGAIRTNGATLESCTVVGNHSLFFGGGIVGSDVTLTNSIVYSNRDSVGEVEFSQIGATVTATYCNIQSLSTNVAPTGLTNGLVGNISREPRFVDPGMWNDAGTPNDFTDDQYTLGNYHLLTESPCIDAGDPNFNSPGITMDVDGGPRIQSCRVDMGIDEFTQGPAGTLGDFDGDGFVTIDDIPDFVAITLESTGLGVCTADFNGDQLADGRDVAGFAAALLGS